MSVPVFASNADAGIEPFSSASASTPSPAETLSFGGKQYTLENVVTDNYSQAILKDCNGKIIADFTYDSATGDLMDNLSGKLLPHVITVKNVGVTPYAANDGNYRYLQTDRYHFILGQISAPAVAAAVCAQLKLGAVPTALVTALGGAVAMGLSSIYLEVDTYTRGDKDYFYIKRVGTVRSSTDDSIIFGPTETVQKVRQK